MLERRNANDDSGHGDCVLVEDDGFGGGETPGIKKGVWAGAMQEICFDEEREREREGGFLESLQQVYFHISFVFLHGSRIPVGVLILKLTRTTREVSVGGVWVTRTRRRRRRNTSWRTRMMSWIGTKRRAWSRGRKLNENGHGERRL